VTILHYHLSHESRAIIGINYRSLNAFKFDILLRQANNHLPADASSFRQAYQQKNDYFCFKIQSVVQVSSHNS
jgi:hypothetical protein